MLNAGEDVLDFDVVFVADQVGDELVAIAGGAAVVGVKGRVAVGGEVEAAVMRVVAEGSRRRCGRPAVDADDQRQLVALLVAGRKFEDAADLGAVGGFPGDVFDCW